MATLEEIRNSACYKNVEQVTDDDTILVELDKLAGVECMYECNKKEIITTFCWNMTPQGSRYWDDLQHSIKGI